MTKLPAEFVALAIDWHHGQSSMLYAVASTGGLYRGSVRPIVHDGIRFGKVERRPMTDDEWDWSLWTDLGWELSPIKDESPSLRRFYEFVMREAERLETLHSIEI